MHGTSFIGIPAVPRTACLRDGACVCVQVMAFDEASKDAFSEQALEFRMLYLHYTSLMHACALIDIRQAPPPSHPQPDPTHRPTPSPHIKNPRFRPACRASPVCPPSSGSTPYHPSAPLPPLPPPYLPAPYSSRSHPSPSLPSPSLPRIARNPMHLRPTPPPLRPTIRRMTNSVSL